MNISNIIPRSKWTASRTTGVVESIPTVTTRLFEGALARTLVGHIGIHLSFSGPILAMGTTPVDTLSPPLPYTQMANCFWPHSRLNGDRDPEEFWTPHRRQKSAQPITNTLESRSPRDFDARIQTVQCIWTRLRFHHFLRYSRPWTRPLRASSCSKVQESYRSRRRPKVQKPLPSSNKLTRSLGT